MKKKFVFFLCVFGSMFLLSSCYSNKELLLSSSLTQNCDKWEAKTEGMYFNIRRTTFGPFTTVMAGKAGIPTEINIQDDLGLLIFSRNVTTDKGKFYSLQFARGGDTSIAEFKIFSSTTEREPSVVRELFGKTKYTDYKTISHSETTNGTITIRNKNSKWNFNLGVCNSRQDCTSGYLRNITSLRRDNYLFVTRATKKEGRKGIIIKNPNDEPVAALQLSGKKIVWISNSMVIDDQMAVATLFAVALCKKGL